MTSMPPMRILQLNFERGWRGGERQTLLTMQALQAAGHHVSLLARSDSELAKRAAEQGHTVYACAGIPGVIATLLRRRRQFHVLHAQTANMMTWLALLKPVLSGRIVFTRRTAFAVKRREKQTAWKWGRADVLVAISQAAAAEPKRFGLSVVVIPSAVQPSELDASHLAAFAQRFGIRAHRMNKAGEHRRFVLATAAALTREKDPCTLIRAVHELRQSRGDFVFLHLGAGGDAEAAACELVKNLALQHHYVFCGFQTRIEDLYRLMDGYVLSSREEALGSSVLDAFLYHVPVVATDAGGLKEVLAQGRGLLCPVGDARAMAAALRRLLDEPCLREQLAATAYAYVSRNHDVQTMAQHYLRIYQGTKNDR